MAFWNIDHGTTPVLSMASSEDTYFRRKNPQLSVSTGVGEQKFDHVYVVPFIEHIYIWAMPRLNFMGPEKFLL